MTSFYELYERLLKAVLEDKIQGELDELRKDEFDPHHLDCLLNPQNHAPVIRLGECKCSDEDEAGCAGKCLFDAISRDVNGNVSINNDSCVGCGVCSENCHAKNLIESRDILPTLNSVYHSGTPVYAMIAPAFVNQFTNEVTPGKLRTAFKQIGFTGMVEVALFADILTLKEALEFDEKIVDQHDFQLTSCCCPMWIAMIRKIHNELVTHIPASVSPMIACGRSIKVLHPNAVTVFIGPCIAKKAEAREKDIAGAVDHVLTFQEMQDIFKFSGINLKELDEDERDHSSRAGRIYATTGGVSEAVKSTVKRLNPNRQITVHTAQADGIQACKEMLNDISSEKITKNFYEGMGCVNGCVGGPKVLIPRSEGQKNVYVYGKEATYQTPIDNPYVIDLLHKLGFDTVESLIKNSDIFTRNF
ncbi:MAG: [Fe-Fe] hydrogenase large subunit C-terminal domain-containing protein [Oscillospiraceae bacterium]